MQACVCDSVSVGLSVSAGASASKETRVTFYMGVRKQWDGMDEVEEHGDFKTSFAVGPS